MKKIHLLVSLCLFLFLSLTPTNAQGPSPASAAPIGNAALASPGATAGTATAAAPPAMPAAVPAAPVIEKPAAEQKVMLMFSATDGDGNPIANVAKSAVSILDNGHLANVTAVQAMPDLPVDLGIILLGRVDFGQQQAAATELIKMLRPGKDRGFVMVAGGSKVLHDPPNWFSDQAGLANEIKNLDKHAGYPDPFEYNLARSAAALERQQTQEYSADMTSFFDFAWQTFTASPRFARRVLVVFRTPLGHAPGMGGRAKEAAQLRQMHVVQGSQFFRTPIFLVGIEDIGTYISGPKDIGKISMPQNAGSGDAAVMRSRDREMQRVVEDQYEGGRINLNEIATDSGGRSWWSTKRGYTDAVDGIKANLAVPYVVSFVASAPAEVHTIKLSAGENVHVAVQQTVIQQMPK